jgi:hypothetical protein
MFRRAFFWLLPALAAIATLAAGRTATHAAAIEQAAIEQAAIEQAALQPAVISHIASHIAGIQAAIARPASPEAPTFSGTPRPRQGAAGWNEWTADNDPDDIERSPAISLRVEFASSVVVTGPRAILFRHYARSPAQPRGPPAT